MLYEYVIDPAAVIEWVKDDRSFQQFKTAFGYGQPRLVSNFPKRKLWRRLVKGLVHGDFSTLELKRVEVILMAFKGQPVVERDGPEYDGTKCWSANALEQHDWVEFNHMFIAEGTTCANGSAFTVNDTYNEEKDCWRHKRQHLICRKAEDVGAAIGNMLRLADRVIVVDPYFRAEHGQMAVLRELIGKALTDRPHMVKPSFEIVYSLDAQRAPSPATLYAGIAGGIDEAILDQVHLTILACIDSPMHNRFVLTEQGGVNFGNSISEDVATYDEVNLLEAEAYGFRWSEYGERGLAGTFQQYPVVTE